MQEAQVHVHIVMDWQSNQLNIKRQNNWKGKNLNENGYKENNTNYFNIL